MYTSMTFLYRRVCGIHYVRRQNPPPLMINVGEQLVASYLQYIRGCEFIQTNLYTIESQGEIDVVGINLKEAKVYVCEVAVHLTTGLQYVKDKRPNNIQKLTEKFSRDIAYANKYLSQYEKHFMLWSPVVKGGKEASLYNQLDHLKNIDANIREWHGVEIEFVINERFQSCLKELRAYAKTATSDIKCPVMRLLQIEEHLTRHLAKAGV
jgi:Holliday junction resolvase-like predicted endonuclease